jgi:hypothetical protein
VKLLRQLQLQRRVRCATRPLSHPTKTSVSHGTTAATVTSPPPNTPAGRRYQRVSVRLKKRRPSCCSRWARRPSSSRASAFSVRNASPGRCAGPDCRRGGDRGGACDGRSRNGELCPRARSAARSPASRRPSSSRSLASSVKNAGGSPAFARSVAGRISAPSLFGAAEPSELDITTACVSIDGRDKTRNFSRTIHAIDLLQKTRLTNRWRRIWRRNRITLGRTCGDAAPGRRLVALPLGK